MKRFLMFVITIFFVSSCSKDKVVCTFPDYSEVRESNLKLSKSADRNLREISDLINNDILQYQDKKWNTQKLLEKDIYFSLNRNDTNFIIESAYFSDYAGSDHSFSFINFLPIKNIDTITIIKTGNDIFTRPAASITFFSKFDNPKAFQHKTIKDEEITQCYHDSSVSIIMGWNEALQLKKTFNEFIYKVQ